LYVKEFGRDAPPAYRGKVLLECMDGTPLFNGETADERQRCLSAIAQGYMDFVGKEGFAEVLIRVPPPTDKHAHLFSARSADVQLKASHHLSQWYLRIMQWGMRVGTLSDYQCSPDGGDIAFPLSILSRRDNEAEASFKRMCAKLDTQEPGTVHQLSHIASADRFFVASLHPPKDALTAEGDGDGIGNDGMGNMGCHLPLIVCPLAANRHRLTKFCEQKRLFFHSIEHAQYSTMVLLREFVLQRQLPSDAHPPTEEELDEEWERQERPTAATERASRASRESEHMEPRHSTRQQAHAMRRQQHQGSQQMSARHQRGEDGQVERSRDASWGEDEGVASMCGSSSMGCGMDARGECTDDGGHGEHHRGLQDPSHREHGDGPCEEASLRHVDGMVVSREEG